jgi:hypothetical protein
MILLIDLEANEGSAGTKFQGHFFKLKIILRNFFQFKYKMSLSAYELKRLKNIEENNKVLKSLGLLHNLPTVSNPKVKVKKKQQEKKQDKLPLRRSLRAKGKPAELEPESITEARSYPNEDQRIKGTIEYPDMNITVDFKKGKESIQKNPSSKFQDYKLATEQMKITPEMIYSIAPFPSQSRSLCAVGDKAGNLCFWDIDATFQEPVVHKSKPHIGPILKVMFQPVTNNLLSCSYDGSIRSYDMNQQSSNELLVHEEAIGHYDIKDNLLWFSDHAGQVGKFDLRKSNFDLLKVSAKKLNTIHLNPVSDLYFCTSGLDNYVRVFDVRNLEGVVDEFKHDKSVNSAFWDPMGTMILSTSFDDTLHIWSEPTLSGGTHLSTRHNNKTGRWIQKFKAMWDPKGMGIVCGNMKRGLDLFDKNLNALWTLEDENITAIPAVNVFHPNQDIILSGNASGKMILWKQE